MRRYSAVLDVLYTLRSLLAGSEAAAAAFGRDVGYGTFAVGLYSC